MLIKHLADCREIFAGDNTRLRELLHPERDPAKIGYSLAIARLEPGQLSLPHRLKQTEVYYIIKGAGTMHVGTEAAPVSAGDVVYIPSEATQWLENDGDGPVEFACIVEPPWRPEDETVLPGA